MEISALSVDGAYLVTPRQHPDDRGVFLESFRGDRLADHLGHRPDIVQTNISVSSRGTVRGIHFADVPPGQGKYVTALTGALLDLVVDVRIGSPTFGRCASVRLDSVTRQAVYLSEGLGHAICALEDDTTAMYLCTATYDPSREHGIHPLDPTLAIEWPATISPLLSPKDAAAPTLEEAEHAGLLPRWDTCRQWAAELADRDARRSTG
jgi:dTDP-4-dehydrorhamnose 3,5-epimerase